MNTGVIYAKTPAGDEAVRQSTRVVQRNLRMVLVQIDGKLSVGELAAKIGNANLVEAAILELEKDGYIVPLAEAEAVWQKSQQTPKRDQLSAISQFSQFSTFGPARDSASGQVSQAPESRLSSFGKPVLSTAGDERKKEKKTAVREPQPDISPDLATVPRRARWWWLALAVPVLLALLVALAFLYPYENHRRLMAQAATGALQRPVTIDAISLRLLPQPHLLLHGVRLDAGRAGEVQAVRILRPWVLLFGELADIEDVSLDGVRLTAAYLSELGAQQSVNSSAVFGKLRRVAVSNLSVKATSAMDLGPLNGSLGFAAGKLAAISLETADRGLLLKAAPAASGFSLEIEGRAWRPGSLSLNFSAMQARGLLEAGRLQISGIDSALLGGVIRGDWQLQWQEEMLTMSGTGSLRRVDMNQLASALLPARLEGSLSGNLRVEGKGRNWPQLWQAAVVQLEAEMERGVLHGVNLGDAARSQAVIQGGSTRFDRMSADISVDGRQLWARDVRLDAGLVQASGQFAAGPGGTVDGRILLVVSSSVANRQIPMRISGVLPALAVQAE